MSKTKREPLLSERLWEVIKSLDGNVADWVIDDLNDIHDDLDNLERCAKDAELIQQLVDALANLRDIHEFRVGREPLTGMDELAAAAAAGFKPTNP